MRAPPEQFSVSLAHLLQPLLSPAGFTPAHVRGAGPSQRQPRLRAAALCKKVYFIFMCQDLYKKGIVQL